MNIKIVTDSTSDLPASIATELGITVVPAYIKFGEDTYRDRVDINESEFFHKLETSPVYPITEPATPEDFADVYRSISSEADAIVSIHISSKLSATCNSARMGIELAKVNCPIEVVDSQLVTVALGLLVIAASESTASGRNLKQVIEEIKGTIPHIHTLGYLETLSYLVRGGRVSKAKALMGSILSIQPLLTILDGEIEAAGQVRNRNSGIDRLFDFTQNAKNILDLAVVYSTTPDEVKTLVDRMATIVSRERIWTTRLGPTLGVHAGPNILFVAYREKF